MRVRVAGYLGGSLQAMRDIVHGYLHDEYFNYIPARVAMYSDQRHVGETPPSDKAQHTHLVRIRGRPAQRESGTETL